MLRSDLFAFMRERGIPVLAGESPHHARFAVVDDEPALVRALSRMLARVAPGCDCRSAQDGFSAGVLLASFRPDIVFLDVVMPGLSGVEVCERIRATPGLQATAVVIVSGGLTGALRSRLTAAGADRLIAKPFDRDDIESAVADLVGAHRGSAVRAVHGGNTT